MAVYTKVHNHIVKVWQCTFGGIKSAIKIFIVWSHHKIILMAGIMADIILFHFGGKIIIALDFTLTVRQPRIILAKWQLKCGIYFTLPVKKFDGQMETKYLRILAKYVWWRFDKMVAVQL